MEIMQFSKQYKVSAKMFAGQMEEQQLLFIRSEKTHQMIEETLNNVLVAIKQNEYLQAWYPEQHGYTAGKVTGMHPAKMEAISGRRSSNQ